MPRKLIRGRASERNMLNTRDPRKLLAMQTQQFSGTEQPKDHGYELFKTILNNKTDKYTEICN